MLGFSKEHDLDFPEGLRPAHLKPRGLWHRHASPISILLLGGLLAAALAGVLGGRMPPPRLVETPAAALSVLVPGTIRNGEFFEAEFAVAAHRPIADLRLAVEPSLWRRLTQNSMIPAASDEGFFDGMFVFSYGPLEAGERLTVKADFQINPDLQWGTAGDVALFDGETELARLPVSMKVLP